MPRLDRLLTIYLCAPLWRLFGGNDGKCIPILTYHSISENLFGYSHPYYQINTTPDVFTRHMSWLRNAGYRTVQLHDLPAFFQNGTDLTNRFVITFDGGYRDILREAWPVMHQCGFTATVFLTTDRIRTSPMRLEGADYMTWQDVCELHSQGISFGSLTVSRADLRSLEPEEIDYELGYSKECIEQKLGFPVRSFSYPFSFPEEDTHFIHYLSDVLENHGFEIGVSNVIGRASAGKHGFFLPRLPINSRDDFDLLAEKMNGGYDWMHLPQWIHKRIHHNPTVMQRASEHSFADHGK
jgi:peptidoglycan/xylan/chitin deacetylase (PgdA/CDA1 family)